MIDYKSARYVTTLAECQTIRAAAEQLYISSPALSMYIKNLESEIECALFSRDKNCFVPTEIGRRYISCAQRILQINQEFEADLVRDIVQEIHPDGVVNFCHWGCKQSSGGAMLLKERMQEIQMPFLILDGDGIDRRNSHDGQIRTRFEAFLEVVRQRKMDSGAERRL